MQASLAGSQQPLPPPILYSALDNFQVISAEVEQRFAAGSRPSVIPISRPRRRERDGGRRTSRGTNERERDAYVSFLIVTGSTRRYRPRAAVPLLPYYILHNSNSERSELLPLPIARAWGWTKEKRRKEDAAEEEPRGSQKAAKSRGVIALNLHAQQSREKTAECFSGELPSYVIDRVVPLTRSTSTGKHRERSFRQRTNEKRAANCERRRTVLFGDAFSISCLFLRHDVSQERAEKKK